MKRNGHVYLSFNWTMFGPLGSSETMSESSTIFHRVAASHNSRIKDSGISMSEFRTSTSVNSP